MITPHIDYWIRHLAIHLHIFLHSCQFLLYIVFLGEISSSAIIIVSNLLVLCGAILGVKASMDAKITKMEAEIHGVAGEMAIRPGHDKNQNEL